MQCRVVTADVIAEKSPAVFVRTRDAPDFPGFLLLARVLIPPGTSGCPIVRVHGSIVWRLYPLHCTRDKVREPAGGRRSLDPPVVRDSLSYVAFFLPINLSLSDCLHESIVALCAAIRESAP